MAISIPSVIAPRSEPAPQKKEQKSDIEKIMEGVQLAGGILGMGVNVQSIREHQGNIEAQGDTKNGIITKKDLLSRQDNFNVVPENTQGAVGYDVRNGDTTDKVFLKPPTKVEKSPLGVWKDTIDAQGHPIHKFIQEAKDGDTLPIFQSPKDPKADIATTQTTELRKEYNGQKTTQNTYQVIEGYNKVKGAAETKDHSPTDDMSLIYGIMKMQDPGSTVREGEYASAENTRGIPDTVLNAYNRALNGQKLTEEQRANFAHSAEGILDSQLKAQETVDKRYTDISKNFKADPNFVLEPSFGSMRQSRTESQKARGATGLGGPGTALGAPAGAVLPARSDIEAEMARRGLKSTGASGGF